MHFRALPKRGSDLRQLFDGGIAAAMLAGIALLSLLCWGPIPVAGLWVGSQINYFTGSVSLGIVSALAAIGVMLFVALQLMRRLDSAWILVRRAANYDQRTGALGRVFAIATVICGGAFMIWFGLIHGAVSERIFTQAGV